MPEFVFNFNENDIQGSIANLMEYMKWFTGHLDDTNIKYLAWGDSRADNVDATHPIKLKFYIPPGVLKVQKLSLNFSIENFRAYETGAASAVAEVEISTLVYYPTYNDYTQSDGSHNHGGAVSTDGDHSHWIPDHGHTFNNPPHTHDLVFGIYESTPATGVKVYVDGTLRLDNGGVGYDADQGNLDLTQWVKTPGWHTIELSSNSLGRINAAYFVQIYVGANGL